MTKRTAYPLHGENRSKKALRELEFQDMFEQPQSYKDMESIILKAREQEAIDAHKHTSEALADFFVTDTAEWFIRYWNVALRPDILYALDEKQKQDLVATLKRVLKTECSHNYSEFSEKIEEESADAVTPTIRNFLFYAKNFEIRCQKRMRALMPLNDYYMQESNGKSLLQFAREIFAKTFFKESIGTSVTHEIEAAFASGIHSVSQSVYYNVGLLANTLITFKGMSFVDFVDPLKITVELMVPAIVENLKLQEELIHNSARECLSSEWGEEDLSPGQDIFTLYHMQGQQKLYAYVKNSIIPLVEEWLERAHRWTTFSDSIISLLTKTSGPKFWSAQQGFSKKVIQDAIDNQADVFARLLSVYAIFKSIEKSRKHGETISETKTGLPTSFVHISAQVHASLVENLYGRIFKSHSTAAYSSVECSFWLLEALPFCKDLLIPEDSDELTGLIERKVVTAVSGNIHREIHSALTSMSPRSHQILAYLDELQRNHSNVLGNHQEMDEWDDVELHGLLEDIASNLLPAEIGGRGIAPSLETSILKKVAKYSKMKKPPPLSDVMINEASSFASRHRLLLLNPGTWLCAKDPTLVSDLSEFERAHSDFHMPPGLELELHQGWSAVKCGIDNSRVQTQFWCSRAQFKILSELLGSSTPLRAQDVVQHNLARGEVTPLDDLLEVSQGLIKCGQNPVTGETEYTVDFSVAPKGSVAKLRFVDDL